MKKKYKWILIGMIFIISAGAYGAMLMKPAAVDSETVKTANLENSFTVQGTIIPKDYKVINSVSSGEVTKLPFQAGSPVMAGEALVETGAVSQTELDLQREQYRQQLSGARQEYDRLFGPQGSAKSALTAAQNEYSLAEKDYSNAKVLYDEGGYVSQMELERLRILKDLDYEKLFQAKEDNSEGTRAFYRGKIDSAEKQLLMLEDVISSGTMKMPYDGVLWELYTEVGSYLAPNQPVAKIYDPSGMKIEVSLLSEDALLIKEDQKAVLKYGDGSKGEGTVSFISRVAQKEISSIGMEENRCVVELTPSALPEFAGAGQQVDVEFTVVTAENVITVPSSAIVTWQKGSVVYVEEGGKAKERDVVSGRKSGGRIEILSGLKDGDILISDPYGANVKRGSRVKAVLQNH